jgi:hypothetical protein
VFYCLSHATSHFVFGYFCLGWPGPWFSYLCFLHSWDDRYTTSHTAY